MKRTQLSDDSEDDDWDPVPPRKKQRVSQSESKHQSNIMSFFGNNNNSNNSSNNASNSSTNTNSSNSSSNSLTLSSELSSTSSSTKTKTKTKSKTSIKSKNSKKSINSTNAASNVADISEVSSDEDDEYEDEDEQPKWSCNQIRGKINKMLTNPDIKITHWLRENGVNSNSYGRFMKLKGAWNGTQNQTYWAGIRYFKKEEKKELKRKEKLKKLSKQDQKKVKDSAKKAKKKQVEQWEKLLESINNYEKRLEKSGKSYDMEKEPIYDDCNDVRKKITTFLRSGIAPSRASWLKAIGNVQANSFNSFMKMGPLKLSGASNKTYYLAYHWFEKLRLSKGEKKNKKRLDNEKNYPNGFEREHDNGTRLVMRGEMLIRKGDHIEIVRRF